MPVSGSVIFALYTRNHAAYSAGRLNNGPAISGALRLPVSATFWKGNFMDAIKPHRPCNDKAGGSRLGIHARAGIDSILVLYL